MEKYMKKSLVTLALMSAFAAPAFAQSNVTVYGVVDAGLDSTRAAGVTTSGVASGGMSDSRIGFKGQEDLGNGVTAKFVLEQGFNVDDGSQDSNGRAFSRQAWVGLASKNAGELRLGRQNSLIYDATASIDPFNVGLAGNAVKFLGYGAYQLRVDNAVTYITPQMGGFEGRVQYGFGETAGSTSDNHTLGFNGSYTTGPLSVSLTRNEQKFNVVGVVDGKATDTLLGAEYDFKVAKAHVAYGQSKFEDNLSGANDKLNNYLVGVSAPVGTGTVLASYIRSDIKDVDSSVSSQFAVGYVHPLSKRTKLYASYAHVSNDDNVDLRSGVAGESFSKFNVGVNHSF
jgi:predicted porin